jgi:GNAT superfamily N-acetyltransferase
MAAKDEYLKVTVTQLEMAHAPTHPPRHQPVLPQPVTLMRVHEPTAAFYRYLYDTVGEPWLWYERRQQDPETLEKIIRDENIAIYVLYYGGVPAGFAEIDTRGEAGLNKDDTLLAYFGLVPDYIGRGLGHYFLDATIDIAWQTHPGGRLIVRTCTLDHPAALPLYQKCGFVPTRQQTIKVPDPRKRGLLPPDAGPVGV